MRGSCFLPLIFVLACATTTDPEPTAPDPCDSWNTEGFFKRASAAEIATCLGAGASTTDRNDGRDSPICMAARFTSDPEVINVLIRHGASANDWCAFNNWKLSECYANASVLHVAARDNPEPGRVSGADRRGRASERGGGAGLDAPERCLAVAQHRGSGRTTHAERARRARSRSGRACVIENLNKGEQIGTVAGDVHTGCRCTDRGRPLHMQGTQPQPTADTGSVSQWGTISCRQCDEFA